MKTTTRIIMAAAAAFAAWQVMRHLGEREHKRDGRWIDRSRDGGSYRRAIARWENEGGATRASRARDASPT
jgi:hypothetical protein